MQTYCFSTRSKLHLILKYSILQRIKRTQKDIELKNLQVTNNK